VTAATDSATAAAGGWGLSQSGPEVSHDGPSEGRPATAARPVPTAPAPTPTTVAKSGRTVVPPPRPERPAGPRTDGSATTSAATVSHLSPQASAAPLGARRDSSDQSAPAPATPVEDGPECAAVAYVDGLDGSERKVLMHHIAQAWPEVVEAGAELVAQWRAEAAEHRRKRGRRMEHERRRRRAAEAGNRG
jgi:hypothetical protein